MSTPYDSAAERFGSARFATTEEMVAAGLVNNGGLHQGFTHERRPKPIGFDADTATVVVGAAGTWKFTSHCAYQLHHDETTVFFDQKGEGAATTGLMMPWADCYFFNPYGLWSEAPWFVPSNHRFNLLDFVDSDSPTLFEDMMMMSLGLINKPKGGGASEHFYGKGVQISTGLLTFLKEFNPHASLIDFYNLTGDIRGGGMEDYFANLHYPMMMTSSYSAVRQMADELYIKRTQAPAEFESIMSTISNSIQILGSPALQTVLSGTSTISIQKMLEQDERKKKFYIMLPAHLTEACAPIIRCMFSAISIVQQRNPKQRIHLLIDEAGQLGHFEALQRLFSFGRGSKTRVSAIFQNLGQPLQFYGQEGFDTLFGNAQTKLFLGVSSEKTAKYLSNDLGKASYLFDPPLKQTHAAIKRAEVFNRALREGKLAAALPDLARETESMHTPDAVARLLRTPDELIHMPVDEGILSIHGKGVYPYQYRKVHYFDNPYMAHCFLPNPSHPPYDRVVLPIGGGRTRTVPIITEQVPDEIAHLPQYSQGQWSYPKGFCPYQPKRRWFGLF